MNIQYRENGSFVSNVDESTAKDIIKIAKDNGYRIKRGKDFFDIIDKKKEQLPYEKVPEIGKTYQTVKYVNQQ